MDAVWGAEWGWIGVLDGGPHASRGRGGMGVLLSIALNDGF